jgi:hypothetical protein
MADVSFDEEQNQQGRRVSGSGRKQSFITRSVISAGLAKDEKSAQTVLLIIAVVALIAAAFITFAGNGTGGSRPELTPEQRAQLQRDGIPVPQ